MNVQPKVAVRANRMNRKDHHYSGDRSVPFWTRVNALQDKGARQTLYALGCVLQNLEEYVIRQLHMSEDMSVKVQKTGAQSSVQSKGRSAREGGRDA